MNHSVDKLGAGAPGRKGGPGSGGEGPGGRGGPGAGGPGSPYQLGKPSDIDLEDLAGGPLLKDDPYGRKGITTHSVFVDDALLMHSSNERKHLKEKILKERCTND